ncbi:MAG: hypothetical protein GX591_02495 [Planctomycetes bacterium]|nr:hypothetical protein [Planctomycetota bacterium]
MSGTASERTPVTGAEFIGRYVVGKPVAGSFGVDEIVWGCGAVLHLAMIGIHHFCTAAAACVNADTIGTLTLLWTQSRAVWHARRGGSRDVKVPRRKED